MAKSSSAALKSTLEGLGYGAPWFVDRAIAVKSDGSPQGFPYGVIQGDMRNVGRRRGDGRTQSVDELAQVDFYQDKREEDRLIFNRLYYDLEEVRLATAPKKVFQISVQSAQRIAPTELDEIVRYTYSLILKRAV